MCNSGYCWNIHKGDVLYLGSRSFGSKDLDRFSAKGEEAIRSLCNKVLNSDEGRRIANAAYGEIQGGRLSLDPVTRAPRYEYVTMASKEESLPFAVAFDEMKGLLLFVKGVEHTIATAKEVFGGKGSYFEEIKQISDDSQARKIGTVSVSPPAIRSAVLKTVYKNVIEERKKEAKKPVMPGLLGRVETFFCSKIDSILEKVFGVTNVVSVARNSTSALSPTDMSSYGKMAIIGGILLFLGGFYAALASANELGVAIVYRSLEKGCLALANVVSGFCATLTGLLFLMKGAAYFAKDIATSAMTGIALPFFVFGMYVLGFFSSLYKIYVSYSFRREIQKVLEQQNGTEGEKLYEAIRLLQQKMELSNCEYLENVEKAKQKNENAFQRLENAFHEKLDRLALRIGAESYDVLKEFFAEGQVSALLEGIERNDPSKVKEAKELISKVLVRNKEHIIWSVVGAVYNLIGTVAMTIYLCIAGPAGSIASSVIFALAAFVSLFVDMQAVRNIAKRIFFSLRENVPILGKAMLHVAFHSDVINAPFYVTVSKVVRTFKKMKLQNCENFEDPVEVEMCPIPTSLTSSTSSDPNGGFRPTRFRRTEEISAHFLAS